MRKKIKIGKPFIEKAESDVLGKAVRLCAEIAMENPTTHKHETKICYYEFEEKYEKYLCPERSDAFVIGLLSSGMEYDMDIEFITPMSERLYYGISTYYIPMVSEYNSSYPMCNIRLDGPTDSVPIKNEKAVATGCSGGVDSFYTIARHSKGNTTKENELTHLVFSSVGYDVSNSEDKIKDTFIKTKKEVDLIAKECGLNSIACYTNLYEFYNFPYRSFNTFFTPVHITTAFALQKLINVYYESSGYPITYFNLEISFKGAASAAIFDLFSLSCFDSENLKFYSAGMECSRIEKEKYIADFKPVQQHLAVCLVLSLYENHNDMNLNCSHCKKCIRTMSEFYAFGKLENLKNVFDIADFKKHKAKYIGRIFGEEKKVFSADIKNEAKKNNVKIPFMSYFYAYLWYKPIKFLRKKLKNIKFIRKLYYKFNIDYKLDGFRSGYEAQKKQLYKKGK